MDRILIFSVFFVASCGLAYELIAGALSSYLLGDSVLQFSSVIGCYLFAMGVGSHLSKYVKDDDVLTRFVEIELLVGLLGGLSATILFLTYSWAAAPFRTVLYVMVFLIGCLVGMEIPLVMRVLYLRKTSFAEVVSRVLTFDYLGALAVSLLFPLVLAPRLGLVRTGFLFGLFNVGIALLTVHVFRERLHHPRRQILRASVALMVLLGGFAVSDRLVHWGEQGMFGDQIVHAASTPYQRLVVTRWKDDVRLYLNGNLQFSSRDEHRYHEALVHPMMESLPWARSVLVLGGGDGLALREVLRYPHVRAVTLVDLDPQMTSLFKQSPLLRGLNRDALHDPRVTVVNADAARWIETAETVFDAIVVDFPDPSNFALGKLYSVPFYTLLKKRLSANGLAVVQATSPYYAPHAYWSIDATLHEAGFRSWPYHAYVPSFGEWGFILAGTQAEFRAPQQYKLPMRFLTAEVTRDMFRFPPDMPKPKVGPNRLNNQSLVHEFERDWGEVIR